MKPTVWTLYRCGANSRWSSASEHHQHGQQCSFSGCNCHTLTKRVKETTDREEAAKWFKQPDELFIFRLYRWHKNAQLQPQLFAGLNVVELKNGETKTIGLLMPGNVFRNTALWYEVKAVCGNRIDATLVEE